MGDPAGNNETLHQPTANVPLTSDSNRMMAIIAYALFLAGWPTLHLATIGGVILAYVQKDAARGTLWESHYDAIITTFWVCLVMGLAALPLVFIGIGLLVYPILIVWFLYRVIRGLVHAIDMKPY